MQAWRSQPIKQCALMRGALAQSEGCLSRKYTDSSTYIKKPQMNQFNNVGIYTINIESSLFTPSAYSAVEENIVVWWY